MDSLRDYYDTLNHSTFSISSEGSKAMADLAMEYALDGVFTQDVIALNFYLSIMRRMTSTIDAKLLN